MHKLFIAAFVSMLLFASVSADHRTDGKHKNRLISKLELTEEQEQPVAEILKEQWKKKREIKRSAMEQIKPQVAALDEETRQRLDGILSEEQLRKYDALSSKRHKRMHKRHSHR